MNHLNLKEHVRHGNSLLPAECYDNFAKARQTPLVCHWHDEFEFLKIISGSMLIKQNDELFAAHEGDLLFFKSGTLHAGEHYKDESVHYRSIVFHPDILCGSDELTDKYVAPLMNGEIDPRRDLGRSAELSESFDKLFSVLDKKDQCFELETRGIIFSMFSMLIKSGRSTESRALGPTSEHVKKAIRYINECYDKEITVAELSEICGLSEGHFCRLFKEGTLKTPTQYINAVRISKALSLLSETGRSITDVALSTGFNSHSYFTKTFREEVGTTPTEFRRRFGV